MLSAAARTVGSDGLLGARRRHVGRGRPPGPSRRRSSPAAWRRLVGERVAGLAVPPAAHADVPLPQTALGRVPVAYLDRPRAALRADGPTLDAPKPRDEPARRVEHEPMVSRDETIGGDNSSGSGRASSSGMTTWARRRTRPSRSDGSRGSPVQGSAARSALQRRGRGTRDCAIAPGPLFSSGPTLAPRPPAERSGVQRRAPRSHDDLSEGHGGARPLQRLVGRHVRGKLLSSRRRSPRRPTTRR